MVSSAEELYWLREEILLEMILAAGLNSAGWTHSPPHEVGTVEPTLHPETWVRTHARISRQGWQIHRQTCC